MIKKTPLNKKHIEILGLFHSLQISNFGKKKDDRIKETQSRLKEYSESSIKNIVNRYYKLFTESLEELEKVSKNITKGDLTRIYNLESLSEMQIDFLYYCLQGEKPTLAAEKAGYKHPRDAASKLKRNRKLQSIFEEQRNAYLETSKFGVNNILGILESTMDTAFKGYDVIEYDEKTTNEETVLHKKIKKVRDFRAVIHAASVWGDFLGAKAADGIREKLSDIKKSELALKKKDVAVKEGLLELETKKAQESIDNYEKKMNRKITIEVIKPNANS